ncbi:hypothetical protein [Rhodopirellula halodulae]|uniref:hypothetical protein n=1 Tax=Rhodopirellula halodulae TaxID=2894198 RepID=UPI001E43A23E|nr:hypothetical protein [Rhodopirellula sp. JC737]MCC9656416.1 hypothetical protein [Rhodopirellula sp. JC737]
MEPSPQSWEPLIPRYEHAILQRYHNGRFASFDVDKLLPVFEPFHSGIVDEDGTVPLRFPGYTDTYELRLGADAVERRVLLTLDIRLPVHAPGFWFCVYCLLVDDFVALLAPTARGIYYSHPDTPQHSPNFDADATPTFASCMTRIETPSELVAVFTGNQAGG